MKKHVMLLAVVFLAACASTPMNLPETMKEACELYKHVRPQVIEFREWAKANWDTLPRDQQKLLLQLDEYLPQLDNAGTFICAVSVPTSDAKLRAKLSGVDWDKVLAVVAKSASVAMQMKKAGAF